MLSSRLPNGCAAVPGELCGWDCSALAHHMSIASITCRLSFETSVHVDQCKRSVNLGNGAAVQSSVQHLSQVLAPQPCRGMAMLFNAIW